MIFLGSLFRSTNANSQWRIGTFFEHESERTPSNLDISLLPVLALRRTFDYSEQNAFKGGGYEKRFVIPPLDRWDRTSLREWPKLNPRWKNNNEVGSQVCFRMSCENMIVWIPALELARSLLFPLGYLARAAFEPNGLDQLFRVTDVGENIRIEALPASNIPKAHWAQASYRNHLAWLLLQAGNKTAFESIHVLQIGESIRAGNFMRWTFDIAPPPLAGCHVGAKGWFIEDTKDFLVFEIQRVHNLPFAIDKEIEFFHPEIKERVAGRGFARGGTSNPLPEADDEFEVDGEESPSSQTRHRKIEVSPINIQFASDVSTRRVFAGKQSGAVGRADNGVAAGNRHDVGVQDGVGSGQVPQADWGSLDQDLSKARFKTKFVLLNKLIELLARQSELNLLSKNIEALPVQKGYSLHLMQGEPRYYLHARFKSLDGSVLHVLEIDISDGSRSIATKVFRFKNENDSAAGLKFILKMIIRKSLRWNNQTINKYCDINESIVHPAANEIGQITDKAFECWYGRIFETIQGRINCQ